MRKHDLVNLSEEQMALIKRLFGELDVDGWPAASKRLDPNKVKEVLINIMIKNEIFAQTKPMFREIGLGEKIS